MSQFKKYLEIVNEASSREYMLGAINDAKANKAVREHNQELAKKGENFVKRKLSNLIVRYEELKEIEDKEEFLKKLNNINNEFEKIKKLISSRVSQKFDDKDLKDNDSIKQIKADLQSLAPGNQEIINLPIYSIKEYIPWVIKEINDYENGMINRIKKFLKLN